MYNPLIIDRLVIILVFDNEGSASEILKSITSLKQLQILIGHEHGMICKTIMRTLD